jgi:hypothetical protein
MKERLDPTDWRAARGFSVLGIDIRECVWCGDGFVRVRFEPKPRLTCSEQCCKENRAAYHRSPGNARPNP